MLFVFLGFLKVCVEEAVAKKSTTGGTRGVKMLAAYFSVE